MVPFMAHYSLILPTFIDAFMVLFVNCCNYLLLIFRHRKTLFCNIGNQRAQVRIHCNVLCWIFVDLASRLLAGL